MDIYQTVTDNIVRAIEAGAGQWRMPWHTTKHLNGLIDPATVLTMLPRNVTGTGYRGVNVLILWMTAEAQGYSVPVWGTYKQWAAKGAQVRKGERATVVVFWKKFPGSHDEDGNVVKHDAMMARGYSVFNAAQVDGWDAPETDSGEATEGESVSRRIEGAEAFFTSCGALVRSGGNRAYYMPSVDTIQMPHFVQFDDPVDYYSTLAHEHTHWTGAASRCDRKLTGRFRDHDYAFEELIAELGAAYVCAKLGLSNEPRPDHAAYLQSWLTVLKDDKRAIFTAASQAQKAVDYLVSLQPTTEQEELEELAA